MSLGVPENPIEIRDPPQACVKINHAGQLLLGGNLSSKGFRMGKRSQRRKKQLRAVNRFFFCVGGFM